MRVSKTHNTRFFETFTPASCYVAGCITSDGCLHGGKQRCVSFASTDEDWIKIISNAIEYNRRLSRCAYKNRKDVFSFRLCGSRTSLAINKNFFIESCKSARERWPSKISAPGLMFQYLRGYLDGDGCVSSYRKGSKRYFHASFYGGLSFLKHLKAFLEKEGVFPANLTKGNGRGVWELRVNRKVSVCLLYEKLYQDSGGLFMPRKHNIFKNFYEEDSKLGAV